MPYWKSEDIQQLLEERNPQRMFEIAVTMSQALGMEYLGLSLHLHIAAQNPQVILYNNYPREWNEHYRQGNFLTIDPIVSMCHKTLKPQIWSDELYCEVPHFRESAMRFGITHGWTQSVFDQRHNESQLSVCRGKRPIKVKEVYDKASQVMWLCNTLHAALSEHHLEKLSPTPNLSERELEVLKWSAGGKTAADVATILSLSTSTVNFHIRSVINKTNAANKAGAIAVAFLRGLL
ncbi:autoinducer binding domain-containing protein [Pseudomonas entomophila]|uniref:Autoinducer binding domain-containing protein n=2 Tax=Pseudomonas entomophila TaxID=312306 RepID=A0ABY9QS59_9PSED|nr:autoinducer binding domain-containing protein [Pseudomonas entomophila]WMW06862.1 autoinducer binding domain-containing protein [Pseudomonas entomophila]CAK17431.1 putative transcriptional regulator, LuxR family [Pseudomonas entomophila L48]